MEGERYQENEGKGREEPALELAGGGRERRA